jgi:glycosyltransferase involved in cell wall biosynthesis
MINDDLNVDFFFGNSKKLSIKKLDFSNLSNFKKEFRTFEYNNFIWYVGSLHILCKNYSTIVLTGDLRVLNNWIILISARLTGKRAYIWTHGWYGREGKTKKFLKELFFNLSHKIFLYGNYAKKLLIVEGIEADKLIPVFNSLDYDKQLIVRSKLKYTSIFKDHFKNDNSIIIFIGRIQKSKRLEQILDAMLLLRKSRFIF